MCDIEVKDWHERIILYHKSLYDLGEAGTSEEDGIEKK